ILRPQGGEKVLKVVQECHHRLGTRLQVREIGQVQRRIGGGLQLAVALARRVPLHLTQSFVERDAAEQFAEVVLSLDLEVARLDATKKSAEHGLDDVLGIDATGQMLADAFAGQMDQAIDVGVEYLSSGVLVTGTQ